LRSPSWRPWRLGGSHSSCRRIAGADLNRQAAKNAKKQRRHEHASRSRLTTDRTGSGPVLHPS
jgi:hypothetical protein